MGKRTVRARVLRIVRSQPHLTHAQIAGLAGCHVRTVRRHLTSLGPRPVAHLARMWGADLTRLGTGPEVPPGARLVLWEENLHSDRRIEAASAAATSTRGLRRLACDRDFRVVSAVAKNPNTAARMLARLLRHAHSGVREAAAANPALRLRDLRAAGRSSSWQVRKVVAASSRTPPDVLEHLAGDDDCRRPVGRNPHTPPAVLTALAGKKMMLLRFDVAANPSCPPPTVRALAQDPHPSVRSRVAAREHCPIELLETLAEDDYPTVQTSVATNERCPAITLAKLADSPEFDVASRALQNPNCPIRVLKRVAAGSDERRAKIAAEALAVRAIGGGDGAER